MAEEKKMLYGYMQGRMEAFSHDLKNRKAGAELANLRRGIGHIPGDFPELWGLIMKDFPDELLSKTGEPTKGEWAAYISLTLYAMHQQSIDVSVNEKDVSIGRAVGKLISSEDDRERVGRRFNAFASATDIEEAAQHLRGLIRLIKSKKIKLDYPNLACDLYDYQWGEESRARVRLRWGQDFYYRNKQNNDAAENNNNQSKEEKES